MKKAKVLFIYPNYESEFRIPLSLSLLSACLKKAGHQVALFDTTFMTTNYAKDDKLMEVRGVVEKTDLEKYVGEVEKKDIAKELNKKVEEFKPDLIGVTVLERNFFIARDLLKTVRENFSIPIIMGGILPTLVPEMMAALDFVDIICIGEGEGAIVDLAERIANRQSLTEIKNLWVKDTQGKVIRNSLRPLVNLDEGPYPDWSIFDPRQMWKAFRGEVYKGGSFEFSRGCLNNCSFCVAPSLREVQGGSRHYLRRKSTRRMVDEVKYMRAKYDFNIVSFCDTNFLLLMTDDDLKEFEKLWLDEVALPFTIQTDVKRIDDFTARTLKNMGCVAVSVGVESGVQEIRQKVMQKYISDEEIFSAFDAARKYGLRTTANYMLGLPFETEEQILQSIEFNLKLNPESIAVHYFTPFLGTRLYDVCLQNRFIRGFTKESDVYEESVLEMPQISKARIAELMQEFVDRFNEQKRKEAEQKKTEAWAS